MSERDVRAENERLRTQVIVLREALQALVEAAEPLVPLVRILETHWKQVS